jgi:hypothetical protein
MAYTDKIDDLKSSSGLAVEHMFLQGSGIKAPDGSHPGDTTHLPSYWGAAPISSFSVVLPDSTVKPQALQIPHIWPHLML